MTKTKIVGNIKYLLGESAIENHQIIKKSKPNYWWFHLENYSSGHCIVLNENINNNIKIIAGNFIKKYTKLKKNNKVNICYTRIKNIKILETPGMVEFYKDIDYFECYSTKIYHYSKYEGGNASEYIIPNGNINITSHAIGSGIYGLTKKQKKDNEYIFEIQNPYLLETNKDCDNYIKASLILNSIEDLDNNTLKKISVSFSSILTDFDEKIVFECLKKFKNDYKNRKDIVMMPINYILMNLNYDGIYSKDTIIDEFSKGNIKFISYPTKKNKTIINYFKKRNTINEYVLKF